MKRLQAEKSSMEQSNDQWLWFVDDELVEALARHDVLDPQSQKRAVQSAALVKALSLNMEGKTEQALREIGDRHRERRGTARIGLDQGASGISVRPV